MIVHSSIDLNANVPASAFRFNAPDGARQLSLAQQYGASAIPLQVVADSSGSVLDKTVGYDGPDAFFSFMRRNAG